MSTAVEQQEMRKKEKAEEIKGRRSGVAHKEEYKNELVGSGRNGRRVAFRRTLTELPDPIQKIQLDRAPERKLKEEPVKKLPGNRGAKLLKAKTMLIMEEQKKNKDFVSCTLHSRALFLGFGGEEERLALADQRRSARDRQPYWRRRLEGKAQAEKEHRQSGAAEPGDPGV